MDSTTSQMFSEALARVFQRYSSARTEMNAAKNWPSEAGEYLHASIAFNGAAEGVITITMPMLLGVTMAEIFEMKRADGRTLACEEALSLVVSVVCHECAVSQHGEGVAYAPTVPVIYKVDSGKWRELSADTSCTVRMFVNDQPLLLTYAVEDM